MIRTIEHTAWHKTKRVIKYIAVLFTFIIVTAFLDGVIKHFINDPWITFEHDWLVLQGAMMYRLISTWNYK